MTMILSVASAGARNVPDRQGEEMELLPGEQSCARRKAVARCASRCQWSLAASYDLESQMTRKNYGGILDQSYESS